MRMVIPVPEHHGEIVRTFKRPEGLERVVCTSILHNFFDLHAKNRFVGQTTNVSQCICICISHNHVHV